MAAAAALRDSGMSVSVFGKPMSFWEDMPVGMLLRSPYVASSIGEPTGPLSLDAFAESMGAAIPRPVPLERFVEYGRWFQHRVVPGLDPRHVSCVEWRDGVFRLILEDGSEVVARRLVVAA